MNNPASKHDNLAKIAGNLLSSLNTIKLAHLRAKGPGSYAQHVALGELYDTLSGAADDFIETLQGYTGILSISIPYATYVDCCEFLTKFRVTLLGYKATFTKMPDLDNKLDEMIGNVSKGLYKLENLA